MHFFELALVGQILLWLIVIGLFLASRQASIYHPLTVYLGFHGLVFVIRPVLVHYWKFANVWEYMRIEPSEPEMLRALAVSSVALLAFGLACLLFGRTPTPFSLPAPAPFTLAQKRALIATTLLLAPLIAYSIRSLTGGGMQGEQVGGTFILTGASGYTLEAQFMLGPLICAWLAITRFKWYTLVPVLLYIAYRSYTGWNRWTIVLLFLGIALVYARQQRILWTPLWAVAAAIPLLFFFMLLGQNRDYFKQMISGDVQQDTNAGLSEEEIFRKKFDTQDFANFDYLCYVVRTVPEKTGTFTFGSQYLQLFTEPIPRKLWPGKPAGAPVSFFNLNAYGNFVGLTPSLAGDGWMSGGWMGVIITLSIAGTFLGLAHRWFWKHITSNLASLFYLIGLAMLPQWFRDGGISISKFLFWNLIPLFIWLGFTWLLGPRLFPAYSVLLPRGTRVRLVAAQSGHHSNS